MRKFAANYVISESGDILKNGIVIAEDDGSVLEYIDTEGQLREIARLEFHNGMLLGGFVFVKVRESISVADFDPRFSSLILPEISGMYEISILKWLEICKKVAALFPDMIITEITRGITAIICSDGGFRKENSPGVYLLTGSDLVVLKLTANCRLKRIL
ncbi:MAG: hypothetical protein WC384_02120 [Prolixibacteraceae bacterium]|jgi:hypothetical protein